MYKEHAIADVFRTALAYCPGVNGVILPEQTKLESIVVSTTCRCCGNQVAIEMAKGEHEVWYGYCAACSGLNAVTALDLRRICQMELCLSSSHAWYAAERNEPRRLEPTLAERIRYWFRDFWWTVSDWWTGSRSHRVSRKRRHQYRLVVISLSVLLLMPIGIWLFLWAVNNGPPDLIGLLWGES